MTHTAEASRRVSPQAMVLPLALAQFIASYAATNMNVAISTIAKDIGTTVIGMQTVITLFTLTMAALMIPGSKLTDIWGRRFCFVLGLAVYGTGALLAALAQGLGLMAFGYSLLEGVGSALMIPPIYILVTVLFPDIKARAKNFGIVSGAAGLGAASGPLIGGLITTGISWRASFGLQVLVVAYIAFLARRIVDPPRTGPKPRFDVGGAILSAVGLFLVVFGVLQSSTYGWGAAREDFTVGGTVVIPKGGVSPVWLFLVAGVVVLALFVLYLRHRENRGRDVLLHMRLFQSRTANLGLATQLAQWLVLQGTFFIISVFLQQVWKFSAIESGLALLPAILGLIIASARAERLATRRPQRWLVMAGFVTTVAGMILLPVLGGLYPSVFSMIPGLFLTGAGVGVMLTSSVNIVQSSFPDDDQGDISGLSRSVSNLGSSFGTALAGSILVAAAVPNGKPFLLSLATLGVIALLGLLAAALIPSGGPTAVPSPRTAPAEQAAQSTTEPRRSP